MGLNGVIADHFVAHRHRRAAVLALQPQMGILPERESWSDIDRLGDPLFARAAMKLGVTHLFGVRIRDELNVICTTTPPIASAI